MNNKIKTFEDACKIAGVTYTPAEGLAPDEIAYQKLKIITKAFNGEWEPDWSNYDENKYYPWFDMTPKGFSRGRVESYCTFSFVPSSLCFKDRSNAETAINTFLDLFKEYMLS